MNQLLQILIRARDQATKAIQSVQRKLGGLEKQTEKNTKASKLATISWRAWAASIALATAAFVKLTKVGGEFLNVQRAFQANVRGSTDAIEQMREATQGLVSDLDLMAQFNRAVQLGAVSTADEFSRLANVAVELGKALRVDAGFALESLTLGIGRRSRLLLDNLGIIVQGLEGLAQDELVSTVLEAAEESIARMGPSARNAADGVNQLGTAFGNLTNKVGAFFAQSGPLGGLFSLLGRGVQGVADRIPGLTRESEIQARLRGIRREARGPAFGAPPPLLDRNRLNQERARLEFELAQLQGSFRGLSNARSFSGRDITAAGGTGLRTRPIGFVPRAEGLTEASLFQRTGALVGPRRGLAGTNTGQRDLSAIAPAALSATDALMMLARTTQGTARTQTDVSRANARLAAGLVTLGGALVNGIRTGGAAGGLSALLAGGGAILGSLSFGAAPVLGAAVGVLGSLVGGLFGGGDDGPVDVNVASISDAAADKFTVIVTNQVVGARGPDDVRATNSRLTREKNLDGLDPFGEFAFG